LKNLPKALSVITSVNPLAYGVDGLRSTLIGISHYGKAVDTAVLCGVAAVLLVVASHLFSKIEA
jgi:ABC-2 type transport system permease protein